MLCHTLTCLCFTILLIQPVFSQEEVPKSSSANASNIFIELGGNGAGFSINYDSRFSRSQKGIGGRIGVGFIPSLDFGFLGSTPSILTIPIALNYLAGKAPHYLEAGAGATIGSIGRNTKGTGVVFIPSIGYRYQPSYKGFTGRVVLSPLINNGVQLSWGISGGVKF